MSTKGIPTTTVTTTWGGNSNRSSVTNALNNGAARSRARAVASAGTGANTTTLGSNTPRQEIRTKLTAVADAIQAASKTKLGKVAIKSTALALAIPVSASYAHFADIAPFMDAIPHYYQQAEQSGVGDALKALANNILDPNTKSLMDAIELLVDSVNLELVAYMYGVNKMLDAGVESLSGDLGRKDLSSGSPINIYREALNRYDTQNTFQKPASRIINFNAATGIGFQSAIQGLRSTSLGKKITSNKTGDIHQGEIDLLHTLVFSKLMAEHVPAISEIHSHDMFKQPGFDFIFENSETLSRQLEFNIENFNEFSISVFRSMEGLEKNVFTIAPDVNKSDISDAALEKFNPIASKALNDAYEEIEQRTVMKDVISNVNTELNFLLENYPDGVVDTFQLEHIQNVINIGSNSLKLFDEGHDPSIYAQLYTRLDVIQGSINRALTQASHNGSDTVNIKSTLSVGGLSSWVGVLQANKNKPVEQQIWNKLMPSTPYDVNVNGVASRKLIEEVERLAKYQSLTQNAANPKAVTLEIGRRAVFDHMGRGAKPS